MLFSSEFFLIKNAVSSRFFVALYFLAVSILLVNGQTSEPTRAPTSAVRNIGDYKRSHPAAERPMAGDISVGAVIGLCLVGFSFYVICCMPSCNKNSKMKIGDGVVEKV